MDLFTLIQRLGKAPKEFLEVVSPRYLNALLNGYGAIDSRIMHVMGIVDDPLAPSPWPLGPVASLNACSRVYLAEPNLDRGVAILLEKFEEVLRSCPDKEPVRGGFAGRRFADVVAEVVKQGRPALLFGEPTPSWVFHYSVGFNLAFEEFDSPAAKADRERIARFSHWLSRQYSWEVSVPWHRLIRIYEGGALQGLEAFVRLWDQFIVSPEEAARHAMP